MKMPNRQFFLDLDGGGSSYVLLAIFVLSGVIAAFLCWSGFVGWVLTIARCVIQAGIAAGLRTWVGYFSWARWPYFLALLGSLLMLGLASRSIGPYFALFCGITVLVLSVIACLAYMSLDLERYEVARGYKTLHNPVTGQELATNLVRYGHEIGIPLLAVAAVGVVGGFALMNQGLYETVGADWYRLGEEDAAPGYADFLAYSLLNLFGVVDLLHVASSYNYVHASYVRQARWPASTLLTLFKSFFTLVLLQQIFASVRRGRLLAETITDFWSPHAPIHERARVALPQHGPGAVRPLLISLRSLNSLTAEQKAHIPRIIADIGPAAVPMLSAHLSDPHEHVRGVAVAALGHLHAFNSVEALVELRGDASAWVRQCLAEALGVVVGADASAAARRRSMRRALFSPRSWLHRAFRRKKRRLRAPKTDPVDLAVAVLRGALADPVTAVRVQAVRSLGLIGQAAGGAGPELIGLLADADETVRCEVAESLGLLGGEAGERVAALASLLQDPSPPIRRAAARALGVMKEAAAQAVPALLPLLREADESVRTAAAEAVGRIGALPEDVLEVLGEGLSSRDNVVRAHTAEALGAIGEAAAEAAPLLAEALGDDNDWVRGKAAEALGKMGEAAAEAVPGLVKALRDPDNWVSALAAEALGEIGNHAARAVPALVRSLRHINAGVRAKAAEALGKMGAAAVPAVPQLVQAARDAQDEVRLQAVIALGEVGAAGVGSGLVVFAALEDGNPEVRAAAVEAVAKREDLHEAGLDLLLRAAGDANDLVKAEVARALPVVAGANPMTIGCLRGLLGDDKPTVQLQAARALGQLGSVAAEAGDALLALAREGEAEAREQAFRALAQIQPPQAVAAFLAGLKDARPEIRKLASAGLTKVAAVPADGVVALVEALRDPEAQVRANAARVLSRLPELPDEAVGPLAECAADGDDGVRLNAALALRSAPPARAREAFRHLLADVNPRMRLLAAGSLLDADAGDAEASVALARALADPAPRVRRAALEWIGEHDPRSEVVLEALKLLAIEENDPELSGLLDEALERFEQRDRKTEVQ